MLLHLCHQVHRCVKISPSPLLVSMLVPFLALLIPLLLFHVAWVEKTSITVAFSSSDPQDAMAFQFVDPCPFIPNGAQWVMVPGRPLMNRVVTGRVHKQNNDLGIATFSPLP